MPSCSAWVLTILYLAVLNGLPWLTLFSGFSRLKKGTDEGQDQNMVCKDEGPVNDGGGNNGRQAMSSCRLRELTVLHCCGFSHVLVPKDLRKPLK